MHVVRDPNQASRRRVIASRLALIVGLFALTATSPSDPHESQDSGFEPQCPGDGAPDGGAGVATVAASDSEPLPERRVGGSRHRVATMKLHLTTPQGTWPLLIGWDGMPSVTDHWSEGHDAWSEGYDAQGSGWQVSWVQSCSHFVCLLPADRDLDGQIDRDAECNAPRCLRYGAQDIEVLCEKALCTIDLEVYLHSLADRSSFPRDESVSMVAELQSGSSPDAIGCDEKDGSTDATEAPAKLTLELTIGPFEEDQRAASSASTTGPTSACSSCRRLLMVPKQSPKKARAWAVTAFPRAAATWAADWPVARISEPSSI